MLVPTHVMGAAEDQAGPASLLGQVCVHANLTTANVRLQWRCVRPQAQYRQQQLQRTTMVLALATCVVQAHQALASTTARIFAIRMKLVSLVLPVRHRALTKVPTRATGATRGTAGRASLLGQACVHANLTTANVRLQCRCVRPQAQYRQQQL